MPKILDHTHPDALIGSVRVASRDAAAYCGVFFEDPDGNRLEVCVNR